MARYEEHFLLASLGWRRLTFASDYSLSFGVLEVDGQELLRARSQQQLLDGIDIAWPTANDVLRLRLIDIKTRQLQLHHNGVLLPREKKVEVPPSRAVWMHAYLALWASFAGFVASYLYLKKAQILESVWALKMGYHTAGWHLLLTLTLFPASVWGQRPGIRLVQVVSAVFFAIHLGIGLANFGVNDPNNPNDFWIGLWNATSAVFFGLAVWWGNKAHADMDIQKYLRADAKILRESN